jgi:hypothetical protein
VRVGKAAAAQVFLRILRICHENVMMLRYRML